MAFHRLQQHGWDVIIVSAGSSWYIERILKKLNMRPAIDGEPDVVIPSERAYYDPAFPLDKLFIVGIKTTCRDRWRQVLNEGKRKRDKYIITLQPGISVRQIREMDDSGVRLVVPEPR